MAKFTPYRTISGDHVGNVEHFVVSNGVTVTEGHMVRLDGGYIDPAAAGESILGVAAETVTGDGSKVAAVYVDPNILYLNDADGDFTQAKVGLHCDLASSSQVDASTATTATAQLLLVEYNIGGDASQGLFKIYESQL